MRQAGPRRLSGRVASYSTLLAVWLLVVAIYAPGQVTVDALAQMRQIESGAYNDWFAPLLDWLWSVPYSLGLRLLPVLMAQVGALVAGFYLLARLFLPRMHSAIAVGVALFSPPVLGYAGSLSRDVWFAGLTLVATGSLARYANADRSRTAGAWMALFLVFVLLGASARQNSLPLTFALLASGSVIWLARRERLPARLPARLLAAAAAGLLGTLATVGALRLAYAAIDARPLHPERVIFSWDLAVQSIHGDRLLLPRAIYPTQDLDLLRRGLDTGEMGILFDRDRNRPLKRALGSSMPMSDARYKALRQAWWSAIKDDPGRYLSVKGSLWLRQIGLTSPAAKVGYFDQSGTNAGHGYRNPSWLRSANRYLALFSSPATGGARQARRDVFVLGPREALANPFARGGLLFSSFLYLIAALALGSASALRALRTRRLVWLAPAGLMLGAVAYELLHSVVLPLPRYRFSYPLIVSVIALGLPAMMAAVRSWNGRRPGRADRPR